MNTKEKMIKFAKVMEELDITINVFNNGIIFTANEWIKEGHLHADHFQLENCEELNSNDIIDIVEGRKGKII